MDVWPPHAMKRALGLSLASALLLGCTVGKNFVPPNPQAPERWPERALSVPEAAPPLPGGAPSAAVAIATDEGDVQLAWWQGFQDPTLTRLIERGRDSNLDVRVALLRVLEARAQREVTAAQYWPNLSLDASFSRERLSQSTPTGALIGNVGNIRVPGFPAINIPNPYNQYQLSADASWELDLFGRVRRQVEAADANVKVSVEDQHAILEAALADIAQNYIELRGAQARQRVARDNLTTIDELLQLTQQRNDAGLTTYIDVSNAAAQAEVTRAELPVIELQITQSMNQLSHLLGREPEALRAELTIDTPMPPLPSAVPVGLPAQLARRRPDIREAEASLHAATAQQGVAVADLFPRLTLSAGGGFQSETAGQLLDWASRFGSFGPALELPVFDRGRWKSLRLYDVRAQEAALSYQSTVLQALHEVDNATTALATDQQRRAWLVASVADNRDALRLSRQRYESGLTNFIDVLDAERTLQQNQLSLVDSVTAVGTDLVRLYRALGGGWQVGPEAAAAPGP
ncbi:MAG: efflux transporter outer membrane subunit [Steroidobacteraceae bacterium]